MRFDPDKAIESCGDDKLGRCEFSKSLGEFIYNCDGEDSIVLGLLGEWGYGKTSIINMTIEHIKEISEGKDSAPLIIRFNPWLFSNQNQLIKKFFDEMNITIKNKSECGDIVGKFKSYVNKLVPPIIGLVSVLDPARAQGLLKTAEYVDGMQSEEESLESIKEDINKLIIKNSLRFIVVIDDIDRLSDFEICQIFQLVKLIADFKNTTYLLSFDRSVIINAIDRGLQKGFGDKYLDKIVQVPIEVPKLSKGDEERFLIGKMNNIIKDIPEDKIDQVYWWNLYHSGIKTFFKNLRNVNRYINILNFNFELTKNEVNIVDLFAITSIQVFLPEVYYEIRENKELFTELFSSSITPQEKEVPKKLCDNIIGMVDESFRGSLKEILGYMFPKVKTIYGNVCYGREWLPDWRKDLRICSPDVFDTFFKFSIPKDKISKKELELVISLNYDFNLFKKALLDLIKNEKILEFLGYLGDYIDEIPKENIGNVVAALMDTGDSFPQTKPTLLGPDTPMKILQIIHQFTLRFNFPEERYDLLKNAIEKSEDSLYIFIEELGIEDSRQGRYGLRETTRPEEDWTVNSEQLEELEKVACNKIEVWAEDGKLAKHNKLPEILFTWKRWDPDKAKKYIADLIKDDESLINFVSAFAEKSVSYSIGDKVPKPVIKMNLKIMGELVELNEIKTRIQSIKDSSFELDDTQEKVIELFLKDKKETD